MIRTLLVCILGLLGIAAHAAPALDRADLEAWADGLFPYALDRADIAGAVIAVVKDGEVLLQKGYGYADVEKKIPVDPQTTPFRPGSISKLFTWTAVMQLVEQGKLDLDRDVNDYLDFEIPATFAEPITMRHLMTHTPGLDEPMRGLLGYDPGRLLSLKDYFSTVKPARIWPPGTVAAYSNYGVALAGYIVQRISGEDFDDYVEGHVFQPLGMEHSTFRQPVPTRFFPEQPKGYDTASAGLLPFDFYSVAPAGSATVTAADMARFMIAHLEAEQHPGVMLKPETARMMHRTLFQASPPLKGMALGFFDFSRNGHRVLWHGGDTVTFHSDLNLLIDENVGLFLSMNSASSGGATDSIRTAWAQQFIDRYFPAASTPSLPTTATAKEHGRMLAEAGPYLNSRRGVNSFFAFADLFSQQSITLNDDGTISTSFAKGLNNQPRTWREVQPFVWQDIAGPDRLAAQVKDDKVISVAAEPSAGYQMRQPASAALSASWNVPLLKISIAILFISAVSWPVAALVRRRFEVSPTWTPRRTLAHRGARLTACVHLLFLLGWFWIFATLSDDWAVFEGRRDVQLRLLQLIGVLGVAGTGVAIWSAWITWQSERSWFARAWSILLALACLNVVWAAFAFNLLTLRLQY